jgi:hypothetical protein
LTPSKKRRNDEEETSETETSDIEPDVEPTNPGLAGASSSTADDFPAVFATPGISEPKLFSRPARELRGMPGRKSLGKTVSAPVGGLWGGGMEVDEEDGFDVSQWAASEDF